MKRVSLVLPLLALSAACGGDSSSSPTPPLPTPTQVNLAPPKLVAPVEGAVIEQNDPATGCPENAAAGYGFQVPFEWTLGDGASGVVGYHIYAKNTGATIAAVDLTLPATHYLDRNCGGYVAPQNLNGWEWKVQAQGPDGTFGPWSETRTFTFNPCKLSRKQYCGE